MSWYRWSIIFNAKEHPNIDYSIKFDRLLFTIHELEKEHVTVVSKTDLKTNILSRVDTNNC